MGLILLSFFYVFTPIGILYLCHKYQFINKLGAVFIAYIIGVLLGNIGILPDGSDKVQDITTMLTIPLAIPLLLFSSNIKEWGKLARVTFLSLVFGVVAVVGVVIAGFFLFQSQGLPEAWKISGMLIGVYTGGTPNLASLKMMLDVNHETYLLTHTYDMAVSVVYLAFLMTLGQKFFHSFLRPFPTTNKSIGDKQFDSSESYKGILSKKIILPLIASLGISIVIFGIGGGLSLLVSENQQMVVVILTITTLSIVASLIPKINRIEKTFEAGMYLILIFSIVVASMADISKFANLTFGLFGYITFAVFGSLFVHVVLSKIFKIDADTMMITSTSLICSPLFVPVIAAAIGNKKVIVSGLTVGIIGYAIGNYLGFIVAEVLKAF